MQVFPQAFPFLQILQHLASNIDEEALELGIGVNINLFGAASALANFISELCAVFSHNWTELSSPAHASTLAPIKNKLLIEIRARQTIKILEIFMKKSPFACTVTLC
jgi:hypothetical protein